MSHLSLNVRALQADHALAAEIVAGAVVVDTVVAIAAVVVNYLTLLLTYIHSYLAYKLSWNS